jgi:protein ImuB
MPRPLRSLDLVFREQAPPAPRHEREPDLDPAQLWLAVCLPSLPFDALRGPAAAGPEDTPAVVVEAFDGRIHVAAANRQARAAGIRIGTQLNAALALAASLEVLERSPQIERASLESLAAWAHALTPVVSLEPPDTLLLEVSGSIKLFGGLAPIKQQLRDKIAERRWSSRLCAAPTPLAALWLARGGSDDVLSIRSLSSRLGPLPLVIARWPPDVLALLEGLGVRTIGDCLRLPRDGFARRAGRACLHDLDRALGRRFDLRTEFVAPERWSDVRELYQESTSSAVLLAAVEHMVDRLVAELRRRQAQIRSVQVVFEHLRRSPTRESFDWVEPTHDRERLASLLRDRIERIVLPAPAIGCRLRTGTLLPLHVRLADLFDTTPVETLAHVLLERLRGRLGGAAVHGMALAAEHRPEHAWLKSDARPLAGAPNEASCRDGSVEPSPWSQTRPLWLLPAPLPLSSSETRRYFAGKLELSSGPERIESGWWDERDVGRDYYTAVSAQGQRLWVYKDLESRDWHLHGLFG